MDEIKKVEIIKSGKKLLDEGYITEEDFTYLKDNIIANDKAPLTPLEELEKIKQKEKEGLITSDEYDSLKKDLLEGKKIADSERVSKLFAIKGSLTAGIINEDDFNDIKKDVLNVYSRRDIDNLQSQLNNLGGYKKLVIDDIITAVQYESFKKLALSGKTVSADHGCNKLYEYKRLMKNDVIDKDDYDAVRELLLKGAHPLWVDETSYLIALDKYHRDGLISEDDFTEIKGTFFDGKKYVSKEVLEKLSGYKKLVTDSVISDADYDEIKGSLLRSLPVKSAEEIGSLKEYNDLKKQGAITQEEYDKYKENLLPRPVEVVENEIKKEKQQKKKKAITWGIVAALVLALVAVASAVVPRMQAKKAYNDYLSGYDALIDAGNYQDAEEKATALLEKNESHLHDDEIATVNSRIAYSSALEELDFTNSMPTIRASLTSASSNLEEADGYGISTELLQFVKDNKDIFDNNLYGTLSIDHSKYKAKKNGDSAADGVSFKMDGTEYFGYGTSDNASEVVTFEPVFSVRGVDGVTRPGGESTTETKKEEKPVINEYDCEGFVTIGFKKISKGKGIEADNIEKIVVLHVDLEDNPSESDICYDYDAVFTPDKAEEIKITGSGGSPLIGNGSLKDDTITVDFGNGIKMKLTASESDPSAKSNSSGSSSSSSSYHKKYGSSGSSSSNKKDYSAGSDWENYDSDKDGRINDKEFQDATNDYMDDYFGNDSSSGNDYSPGSDWENYDSNYDGKINDREFQDAVGDYMDKYGY